MLSQKIEICSLFYLKYFHNDFIYSYFFFFLKKCLYDFLNRSEDSGNKLFEIEKLVAVECKSFTESSSMDISSLKQLSLHKTKTCVSFVQVYVHLIMTVIFEICFILFFIYIHTTWFSNMCLAYFIWPSIVILSQNMENVSIWRTSFIMFEHAIRRQKQSFSRTSISSLFYSFLFDV